MNVLKRFFLATFLFSLVSFDSFSQGYKISIRVKGIKDSTCYLAYHFGDKQYLKDTAKADSKGLIVFEGNETLPGGIYLAVLPGKKWFEFIVSEQNFSLETDTSNYIQDMKVKGSLENELFFSYQKYIYPRGEKADSLIKQMAHAKTKEDSAKLREQVDKVNKEVFSYRDDIIKNNPKTFVATLFKAMIVKEPTKEEEEAAKARKDSTFKYVYYKNHFWDNINFSDDRITRSPIYHSKLKEYFTNLVYPNVDSINKDADILIAKAKANKDVFKYTVFYITNTYETSNLMGADAVYVHMVKKYYMTKQAFWVDTATLRKINERAMLLDPLLIGKKAPQLVLADSNRKYVPLYSVKAKYTVVFFWDPNCGHCQKETPKLNEVYKKYKNDGVEVYAVDIDRDRKKWVEFINKNQLHWINVYDPDYYVSFKQLYDIYSTPVMYVLNEKKEIMFKRIGVEQFDDIMADILKKPKEKKPQQK
jgi:peroxiredoxin